MKCLNHCDNQVLEKASCGIMESNNPPTLNVEFDELEKGAYTWARRLNKSFLITSPTLARFIGAIHQ